MTEPQQSRGRGRPKLYATPAEARAAYKARRQSRPPPTRPSIDDLQDRFRYDPASGKIDGPRGLDIGRVGAAGAVSVQLVEGVECNRARLAFVLMTGRWPDTLFHIDGDKTNDRWNNLAEGRRHPDAAVSRTQRRRP